MLGRSDIARARVSATQKNKMGGAEGWPKQQLEWHQTARNECRSACENFSRTEIAIGKSQSEKEKVKFYFFFSGREAEFCQSSLLAFLMLALFV